jgi:hypothetical protein
LEPHTRRSDQKQFARRDFSMDSREQGLKPALISDAIDGLAKAMPLLQSLIATESRNSLFARAF